MTSLESFWCVHYQLWIYFTPFSTVPIVDFEQVNAGYVYVYMFICSDTYRLIVIATGILRKQVNVQSQQKRH